MNWLSSYVMWARDAYARYVRQRQVAAQSCAVCGALGPHPACGATVAIKLDSFAKLHSV